MMTRWRSCEIIPRTGSQTCSHELESNTPRRHQSATGTKPPRR
jgi:hypothetical protein